MEIKEESQEKMYMEESISNKIDFDTIDINAAPPIEEPDRQHYYIAKCRELVKDFERENGRLPKACVTTFGCPMVYAPQIHGNH